MQRFRSRRAFGVSVATLSAAAAAFHPSDLFDGGAEGVAYDPYDLSTMWADAGTTPAVLGGTVAQLDDVSGNGHHASQGTDAARPLALGSGGLFFSTDKLVTGNIDLSGTDAVTVIMALRKRTGADSATQIAVEFTADTGTTNGGFYVAARNAAAQEYGFGARGSAVEAKYINGYAAPTANQLAAFFDISADMIEAEIDGSVATLTLATGAVDLGTGNFANAPLHIGGRGTGSSLPLFADIGRMIVIAGDLRTDATAFANAKAWVGIPSTDIVAFLGDSTTAVYGTGVQTSTGNHISCEPRIIAVAGNTIAQQETAFDARSDKADFDALILRPGLNDLDPLETAVTALGRYQSLVDTINADVSVPVIVSQITPCRQRLIDLHGAILGPVAYQKWLDMNDAIAGNGLNAITGVDGRVTAHVALLNDGSGNLAAAYETGDNDHIHMNDKGRAIIGNAENTVLQPLL